MFDDTGEHRPVWKAETNSLGDGRHDITADKEGEVVFNVCMEAVKDEAGKLFKFVLMLSFG